MSFLSNVDWIKKQLKKTQDKDLESYTHEQRIRLALTELGTTFIKLGQILSTRSDVISHELAKELSKLQSSTPADGIVKVRNRIKNEFAIKSINELFASFETKPLASASIAQVHRATLHSGEQVVVKVMHDQKAADDEENVDAEVSLGQIAEMKADDGQHSQRTQTVDIPSVSAGWNKNAGSVIIC